MRGEVLEPLVDELPGLVTPSEQQGAHELLDELALERLDPARAERRALEQEPPALVQERVGLHLVAEHRGVAAVELELDAGRQRVGEPLQERLVVARAMARRRHEVDAVGVGLDRGRAQLGEAVEERADDRAALGRHAVGGLEIVPVPAREAEIAVERVDQDLERLLERGQVGALGGVARLAHPALGAHAEVAQVAQELGEDREGVGDRRDPAGQHQRGVERGDVHVEHGAGDALLVDRGVAPAHGRDGPRQRHRLTPVQVLAEQERVDLRRRAPERARLIVERDDLRLGEVGRREHRRQAERLDHVVERVRHQPVGGLPELTRDLRGVHVGPLGRGDAEVAGEVLEPEAGEVAGPRVVELGEHPGVHDVAARDFVAPVAEGPLGDLQARDPAGEWAPVAPPGERDPVEPRAGLQVLEVEAKDVVALDDVRIALADEPRALGQQRRLVEAVPAHDVAKARRVGERDRDDAVARPRGAGELVALARQHLDVEGEAPQLVEAEAAERGPAGPQQVLVDGVGEELVGCGRGVRGLTAPLAASVARAERVGPRGEVGAPAELARALEGLQRDEPRRVADERPIGDEEEG